METLQEIISGWEEIASPTQELDRILSPCTRSEFVNTYLGKTFLHVPGFSGKLTHLFPWSALNDILRHHRLPSPQLRLVKEGRIIPAEQIFKGRESGLSAPELTRQLREGATLVIDKTDEMYEPVTRLAEEVERILQARITVNLYACWRAAHAFDMHWDDHDVIILQISGQKRWQIFGETEKFPIGRTEANCRRPSNPEPVWEATLKEGDVLYLPRGWWHVAHPCNEPTLHLTVGIYNPTALDMFRWLNGKFLQHECMRMDIPRFADPGAQTKYKSAVREAILAVCDTPGLMDEYLQYFNETVKPRARFGFPWSATDQIVPPNPDCSINLI
jgi:ribosomal protein L16 Arg81 hydroxylase